MWQASLLIITLLTPFGPAVVSDNEWPKKTWATELDCQTYMLLVTMTFANGHRIPVLGIDPYCELLPAESQIEGDPA